MEGIDNTEEYLYTTLLIYFVNHVIFVTLGLSRPVCITCGSPENVAVLEQITSKPTLDR